MSFQKYSNNKEGSKNDFVASVSEAKNATEKEGKFTALKDKLELSAMKGNEEDKAKFETLQKLPELAQNIFDKLQENGQNQNVRYTAKLVEKDNVGKDGTVYAKEGDLQMSITIPTSKDRKLMANIDIADDGSLKVGYVSATDKNQTKEITKKDGEKTQIPVQLGIKDFSDREKDIFNLITDNASQREKVDYSKAFDIKNQQVQNLKDAGYDVYVVKNKNKTQEYTNEQGETKQTNPDFINFGQVEDGTPAIQYSIASPQNVAEGKKPLPNTLEITVTTNGDIDDIAKVEFKKDGDKTKAVKESLDPTTLDDSIVSALTTIKEKLEKQDVPFDKKDNAKAKDTQIKE